MKEMKRGLGVLLFFVVLTSLSNSFAQTGPPPPPAPPPGRILNEWHFQDTNLTGLFGGAALSYTNVALVPDWAGNGLLLDSPDPAFLNYAVVRTNSRTNIDLVHGSFEMWFSPDWNSSDGLGNWGTLLEVGTWNTNLFAATGAWGLYISPDGSNLYFSSQTNGAATNYLGAPISWNASDWHHIALTYSPSNSELYLDGQLATNGPGVSILPGADILTNGFSLGSDGNGTALLQARGVFNNLITYNYQLDAQTIADNYDLDSQFIGSLSTTGLGMDTSSPPGPPGDGGTNSGGGEPIFNSPQYTTNDFWLEALSIGTNIYNTNSSNLTIILHGTIAGFMYQILSTTNLLPEGTIWTVEQNLIGSQTTNFTIATIPLGSEPQKFFKAFGFLFLSDGNDPLGSTFDSDGDGLPDSWETAYGLDPHNVDTGETGILDAYKMDSAGDGYNNLQKYRMGIPPNVFVTPGASYGFTATMNTNGAIKCSWPAAANLPDSGGGAVTGYTLEINDAFSGITDVSLGTNQLSYEDTLTNEASLMFAIQFPLDTFFPPSTYSLRINYAHTNSLFTVPQPPFDQTCSVNAAVIRGPLGGLYLTVSRVPENVKAVRVMSGASGLYYPLRPYDFGGYLTGFNDQDFGNTESFACNIISESTSTWPFPYFDVPVSSISNGLYQVPASKAPLFGAYALSILGVGANGNVGSVVNGSPTNDWDNGQILLSIGPANVNVPFFDGRTNIQQNINFYLRAAEKDQAFAMALNRLDSDGNAQQYDILGQPTNYVWDGFSFQGYTYGVDSNGNYGYAVFEERNEFEPFEESSLLTNAIFNLDLFNSSGQFAHQLNLNQLFFGEIDLDDPTKLFDTYAYVANNSSYPLTPLPSPSLDQTTENWICSAVDNGLISHIDGSITLPSGLRNIYGLTYQGIKYFDTNNSWQIANSGATFNTGNFGRPLFQEVAAPVLSTLDYYFGRPRLDPLPGETAFAVTNTTPALIATPFGQEFFLTAWARQSISGSYSGVYAFPQQYFDKAFLADAAGNITTNQTGVLSEYGDFFPTLPGKVFLTTKADAATGSTGQCPIYVLKMQADVNHDGAMDLSFAGPDNTSEARPMVFWLNNDRDDPGSGAKLDQDVNAATNDYSFGQIRSQRNLEDFARLWVCGVPSLPSGHSYSVNIGWSQIDSGAPRLRLYWATETNGGTGYLTNTNTAAQQLANYNFPISEITPSNSVSLPLSSFTNGLPRYFLFEAGAAGKGALTLTIAQGTNALAQSTVWLDFHDILDLYEQTLITNVIQTWPEMVQQSAVSGYKVLSHPSASTGDSNELAILVHGWNMTEFAWYSFSQTMFKRLYWKGYEGQFASVRWPTRSGDTDTNFYLKYIPSALFTYNRSEHIAFESANGTASYFNNLRQRYTNFTISACAHSMGNITMMEALNELGQSNNSPIDNYVLMQAAVPAQSYDVTVTNAHYLVAIDGAVPTPNTYSNYAAGITNGLRGSAVNFYNPDDYALLSWEMNQGFFLILQSTNGPDTALTMKPNTFLGYSYDAPSGIAEVTTNFWQAFVEVSNVQTRVVSEPFEVMPFVSRPRSLAVGVQPGVGGVLKANRELNLKTTYGFGGAQYDHSGEFNRNIQSTQVQGFYSDLISALFP